MTPPTAQPPATTPPRMTQQDYFQLFLLSAFWGLSFIMMKWAGQSFPPFWVALLRSVFGACVLLSALGVRREKLPPREAWPLLAAVAFFSNALPWLLFALGELSVSSSIASILNATTPLFTLLIGVGLRDAQVSRNMLLGVLVGLAGVALTVSGGFRGGEASWLGVAEVLLAAFCYGVGSTLAKRKVKGIAPLSLAASQMICSAFMLLPFALFGPHPGAITAQAVAGVAVLGVFGSGLAYLLFYSLLGRLTPTQTSATTYILPIWGLLWGSLAGEKVGLWSLAGVVVVLAGVWLLNKPVKKGDR